MFKKKAENVLKIRFDMKEGTLSGIPDTVFTKELWLEVNTKKEILEGTHLKGASMVHISDMAITVELDQGKDKTFEKKNIKLSLMTEGKKPNSQIAKAKLNLASFADPGASKREILTLITKDKREMNLSFKIDATLLSINGKKVVTKPNASTPKGSRGNSLASSLQNVPFYNPNEDKKSSEDQFHSERNEEKEGEEEDDPVMSIEEALSSSDATPLNRSAALSKPIKPIRESQDSDHQVNLIQQKRDLMVSTSMVSANSSAHTSQTDETSSTQDDDVSVPASVVSAPLSLNTKNTSESHADDNTRDRPQFGSEKGQRKSSAPAALSPSMSRLEQEALEEEIRELKRNAKKKDLEMERMKDEILDRKDSIVEKDKQIGRLKRQLEESKNTIEEVKREYQAPSSDREQELKEENDRLNLTVVELKKELKKEIEKSQRKDREAVFLKEQATRAQEDASAAAHTSDSKKEEKLRKQLDAARERVEEYRLLINAIYNAEAEYEENNGCPSGVRSIVSRLKEWETFDGETDPKVLFDIIDTIRLCYKKGKREEEKLISWLGYSVALLHRTIPLHENGKNEDIYSDHRDVDKLHPYDRYYTLLFSLIFDIYSDFISCICNELDQIIIIPYIQTKMKKNVNHNLAEFSEYIGNIVQLLRKHHLSNSLITSITKQILSVVDAHLFNSLLQRPDLFTGTSGMQIKIAISQIESAVNKLDKYISNIIRDEIVHTREAANFLATADKSIISDPQIAHQMIPHLNPVQLKFFIDRFNSTETGSAVPESVKSLVTEACKKDWDQPLEVSSMKIDRQAFVSAVKP